MSVLKPTLVIEFLGETIVEKSDFADVGKIKTRLINEYGQHNINNGRVKAYFQIVSRASYTDEFLYRHKKKKVL